RRRRVAGLHGGAGAAAQPRRPRLVRRNHAPLFADRTGAPVAAAITTRGRADGTVRTAAHLERPRGHRAGGTARSGCGAGTDAVRVRPHPVRRVGPAAPWLAQRCRASLVVLPEQKDDAGEDAGLRRLRRRAFSVDRLCSPGRRPMTVGGWCKADVLFAGAKAALLD